MVKSGGKTKQKVVKASSQAKKKKEVIEPPVDKGIRVINEYFEVDKVVDKRKIGKRSEYRIRWKNCTSDDDTWEPTKNLCDSAYEEAMKFSKAKGEGITPKKRTAKAAVLDEGGAAKKAALEEHGKSDNINGNAIPKEDGKDRADEKPKDVSMVEANEKPKDVSMVEANEKSKDVSMVEANEKPKDLPIVEANDKPKDVSMVEANDKPKDVPMVKANERPKDVPMVKVNDKPKDVPMVKASDEPTVALKDAQKETPVDRPKEKEEKNTDSKQNPDNKQDPKPKKVDAPMVEVNKSTETVDEKISTETAEVKKPTETVEVKKSTGTVEVKKSTETVEGKSGTANQNEENVKGGGDWSLAEQNRIKLVNGTTDAMKDAEVKAVDNGEKNDVKSS